MLDSLDLSQVAEIDRIVGRLAFLAPSGRSDVFCGLIPNIDGLEAFAVISSSKPEEVVGFKLVTSKKHRCYRCLGIVVNGFWRQILLPARIHELGERFCKISGIDKVVGSRICSFVVKDCMEYYYQKQDLAHSSFGFFSRIRNYIGHVLMGVVGMGSLPVIGATAASAIVSLGAWILQGNCSSAVWNFTFGFLCLSSSLICCALEDWAKKYYFAEDPREVVLDEVAGISLALLITGPDVTLIVAVFLVFRFFDIFKVGIKWIEKKNILGTIVWDDLLAGLYAGFFIKIIRFMLG